MGTLRTLFAISVVFAHSIGFVFVGGQNAVRLFYMISGFLISFVLVERKSYSSIVLFYINRYLRLYPIYLSVAVLSLIAFFIKSLIGSEPNIFKIFQEVPISALILLVFTNVSIFLQDWLMFCGIENNSLVFSSKYFESEIILYQGLLIPQAWTLGVELEFYLIAPFVLVRKNILLLLLLLSLLLRTFLISIGLGSSDPWQYRFFPAELALFLIGALAHQVILPFYQKIFSSEYLESFVNTSTYGLILITLIYWLIPIDEIIKSIFLILIFFVFMPFAFIYQSKCNWDKWIGDLSYPIYICHLLVFNSVSFVFIKFGVEDEKSIAAATIILTITLSIALNFYIANPVESLRNRFRKVSSSY